MHTKSHLKSFQDHRVRSIQKPCCDITPFSNARTYIQINTQNTSNPNTRLPSRVLCGYLFRGSPSARALCVAISRDDKQQKHILYTSSYCLLVDLCGAVVRISLSLCAASLRAQPDGAAFKFNESIDLLGASKVGRQPPIQASLLAAIVEFCFGQYVCAFRKFAGPMMCETSALSFVFFYLSRDSDNDNCDY